MSEEKKTQKPAVKKPAAKKVVKKQAAKKQPKNKIERKNITIDAKGKSFGRVCSEAAKILIGKHKVTYKLNADMGDFVIIENSKEIKYTGNSKLEKKMYHHHSGYPGGLKSESLAKKLEKSVEKTVKDCVRGMLPANRLRDDRLKRLTVK